MLEALGDVGQYLGGVLAAAAGFASPVPIRSVIAFSSSTFFERWAKKR
jgi:hypothetical protein